MDTVRQPSLPWVPGNSKAWLWPSLALPSGVDQAARLGYFACLAVCALTLFSLVLGGTALGAMVDIFFFLMAGCGIRCCSRLAAGSAMVLLIAEKLAGLAAGHWSVLGALGLLTLPFLFRAAQAAYTARDLPPPPPPAAAHTLVEQVEGFPFLLWPKIWIAFRFYLFGLIAMMLAGLAFQYAGLLS